ncbi:MAG: hypothetical protein V4760_06545 [Bdellovibrionota bacterium]
MMTPLLKQSLALASLSLVFAGCVSVNIGGSKAERSKGVRVSAPSAPFTEIEGSRADGAWKNSSNGNSISYLSTCNDPADPSLETATNELFSDLKAMIVKKQATTTFSGREALDTEVDGKMEGIATRVRSVVFKKNGCLYTLSLVGVAAKFDEDRSKFDQFLTAFEAP